MWWFVEIWWMFLEKCRSFKAQQAMFAEKHAFFGEKAPRFAEKCNLAYANSASYPLTFSLTSFLSPKNRSQASLPAPVSYKIVL
nr:hypothetical protein [Jeotgalibacillus malaysiensis]